MESVETCLNAIQSRFMVRAIRDPRGIGEMLQRTLLRIDKSALDGEILLRTTGEWGRECSTIEADIRTLGVERILRS